MLPALIGYRHSAFGLTQIIMICALVYLLAFIHNLPVHLAG